MRAFLEFCYIARRDIHDTHSLEALEEALQRFHHHREVFRTSGIRSNGFNLPRQHSLIHYSKLIRAFGAPNGLCSSITESKHIKAVKEPWRRSNRFDALSQMLLTNQRLDKLAAARVDFVDRGMLQGTCLSTAWDQILCTYFPFHSNDHLNLNNYKAIPALMSMIWTTKERMTTRRRMTSMTLMMMVPQWMLMLT